MGKVNSSYDHMPPQAMYKAARRFAKYVKQDGGYNWFFDFAINKAPTQTYRDCVNEYLTELTSQEKPFAWKLPESTLSLPWLIQMFPDAHYIHWVRDGRDNILKWHGTEDLSLYDIESSQNGDRLHNATLSWKYHEDLIEATPKPKNWIKVRLEDFVLNQCACLDILSTYLDCRLNKVEVFPDVIGRYKEHDLSHVYPIMERQLKRHGYVS